DFLERQQHLLQRHLRQAARYRLFAQLPARPPHITLHARHGIDIPRRALEALVFLQPPDQLGARVLFAIVGLARWSRQQHARFDLGQGCRHHQVFARQLQLQVLHQLDVLRVLARDLGDRNIENVYVLPPDQVQQQIERTFEGLEEDLQRLWRDIQVTRQMGQRL